jgi:hypothetical protein
MSLDGQKHGVDWTKHWHGINNSFGPHLNLNFSWQNKKYFII